MNKELQEIEFTKQEFKILKERYSQTNSALQTEKEKNHRDEKVLIDLKNENQNQKFCLEEKEKLIEDLSKRNAALIKGLNETRALLNQTDERAVQQKESELNNLRSQFEIIKSDLRERNEQLVNLQGLRENSEAAQNEFQSSSEWKLFEKEEQIKSLNLEVSRLQSILVSIKEEMNSLYSHTNTINQEKMDAFKELEFSKNDLNLLKEKYAHLEKDHKELLEMQNQTLVGQRKKFYDRLENNRYTISGPSENLSGFERAAPIYEERKGLEKHSTLRNIRHSEFIGHPESAPTKSGHGQFIHDSTDGASRLLMMQPQRFTSGREEVSKRQTYVSDRLTRK